MTWTAFVNELKIQKITVLYSDFNHLKVAMLAQAILESGRGTSLLFREHKNPWGMKWRGTLNGNATRVSIQVPSEEGIEDFSAFETYTKAMAGYWHWMFREPYAGWEKHTSTPEEFLKFIGPIWCPPGYDPDYYMPAWGMPYHEYIIKNLFPEARELLGETEVSGKVTWFEFNKTDDNVPSCVGYAGSEPMVEYRGNNKQELIEFLIKHPEAGTFLVADTRKIIPTIKQPGTPQTGIPKPDRWVKSPNFSSRGGTISKIFLHNTAGSFDGSLKRLTTRYARNNASAHLLIGRDGEVVQMVDFDKVAWHVRGQNQNSIGIEIEASRPGHGMTPIQEQRVIEWCRYLLDLYGLDKDALDEHRNYNATACPEWIWRTGGDFDAWVNKHFI